MNDVLVISPSGKLYGSERVLLDFIYNTTLAFDLAIPDNGNLRESLDSRNRIYKVLTFNPARLSFFYIKIVFFFSNRQV